MLELLKKRHSVRQYTEKEIEEDKRKILTDKITEINKKTGLNFQICFDEPKAFDTFLAHYGKFSNVKNYIVLIGTKNNDEAVGYWGEHLVLKAQELGLNTCWVALTYGKKKVNVTLKKCEKIYCVLALGYGKTQGVEHKVKAIEKVSNSTQDKPKWFFNGVQAALLAPTAMNQQKFKFVFDNDKVIAKPGRGFYTKIDLGIAKYHFEIGANRKVEWC